MLLCRYDAACEVLGELWRGAGEPPRTEGLDRGAAAHVVQTTGALTSRLGSLKQIEGAQERAKDLLTEAVALYKAEGDLHGEESALVDLGYCYWRASANDEARVIFKGLLERGEALDPQLRALATMYLAIVERMAFRLHESLRLHEEGSPLFRSMSNDVISGAHHNEYGMTLRRLGESEMSPDYLDRALIEFAAADYHFTQAGNMIYVACVKNQLAMSVYTLALFGRAAEGDLAEAHRHLDRAAELLPPGDRSHRSSIRETRAKLFLVQRRPAEAEREARAAVKGFRGDDITLRAEARVTLGMALCDLGRHGEARHEFELAESESRAAGAVEVAGLAALTLIEQLGDMLAGEQLTAICVRAAESLAETRDRGLLERLRVAALITLNAQGREVGPISNYVVQQLGPGFNFFDEVERFEQHLLRQALERAAGQPTATARLLGMRHQTLTKLLDGRHKELRKFRVEPSPRRRSIIAGGARKGRKAGKI